MIRKSFLLLAILAALGIAAFLNDAGTAPAHAQTTAPENESLCRTCHEDLYYLYDTGQWYCLCGKQRACVDCHAGNPDSYKIEEAHEGLVANPIAENPAVCQDCHPDDSQVYIEKFSQIAGIDPVHHPAPTHTPLALAMARSPEGGTTPLILRPQPLESWRIAGFVLLAIAFLGVLLFGYRCWRADCLAKSIRPKV